MQTHTYYQDDTHIIPFDKVVAVHTYNDSYSNKSFVGVYVPSEDFVLNADKEGKVFITLYLDWLTQQN